MPKPREEDDDLFHDAADVEFVDGEDEKPAKKRKTAKKKTAKKKVVKKKTAKKKAAPKRKKKAAPAEDVEELTDDDTPKRKAAKKKTAKRSVVASDEVEIQPRKKKPAVKKKAKSKPAAFGAGLLFDEEAEDPADEASANKPADEQPAEAAEAAESEPAKTDESVDEYGRPEPPANYVVHVYELGRLKRTIDRDFTAELAEAYATAFSKAAKNYGRKAIAGKKDTQPAAMLD